MAENVKVVLNRDGVRELLRSDWAMSVCQELANAKAAEAGAGHGTDQYVGRNRVNVSVSTKTKSAFKKNLKNNVLLKMLGGRK